jgi:hypothetical protein
VGGARFYLQYTYVQTYAVSKRHDIPAENVQYLVINPLAPELNPSAQRCLTRFFTGDFDS